MAAGQRLFGARVDPERLKTIRSASGPLRAILVGLALGSGLLLGYSFLGARCIGE
jgi:hypothetical protein